MSKVIVHTIALTGFFLLCTVKILSQEQAPVVATDSVAISMQGNEDSEAIFNVISDSPAIRSRSIPDSVVEKMRSNEDYWYVNTVPERQKSKEVPSEQKERWYQKEWFTSLLWFLIIGSFVTILIWFLASSNIKLFRKKPSANVEESDEITEETIFSLSYEKEIQKAVAAENYRLAIRLWYLYILKGLAERNLIQYKQEKTNSDYVNELYKTPLYKDFFQLTRSFEYTWYGQFALSAATFALLQKDFLNFKQQLQ
ncbi:MAG TPA: hypothetical protein VFS22_02065 [Flavisolibacter sp.]|nr:hypothetical protein [Flavisolibacter sp.]